MRQKQMFCDSPFLFSRFSSFPRCALPIVPPLWIRFSLELGTHRGRRSRHWNWRRGALREWIFFALHPIWLWWTSVAGYSWLTSSNHRHWRRSGFGEFIDVVCGLWFCYLRAFFVVVCNIGKMVPWFMWVCYREIAPMLHSSCCYNIGWVRHKC